MFVAMVFASSVVSTAASRRESLAHGHDVGTGVVPTLETAFVLGDGGEVSRGGATSMTDDWRWSKLKQQRPMMELICQCISLV